MRFPFLLVLALCSTLLTACGGGGSSSSRPGQAPAPAALSAATLSGNYTVVMAQGTMPRTLQSFVLRGTSDAAGALMVDGYNNDDGVVGTVGALSMRYTIAADGAMTLSMGNILFARGGISRDGGRAVLGMIDRVNPGIVLMLRTEGTYSTGSLRGGFQLGDFARIDNNPATWSSALHQHDFSGTGAYSGVLSWNQEGAVAQMLTPGAQAYAVDASGKVDISFASMVWSGQLAAGGQYGILGGDMTGNGFPLAMVLAKRGANMGVAQLAGDYWAVRLDFNSGALALQAFQGSMTASDTGAIALSGETNTGSGGLLTSETGTASVAGDGAVVLNRTGVQELMSGQLSPDGEFGFVCGGLQSGSDTTLMVFIRK